LQEHIDAFIAAYNQTAEPFAWTKKKVHQRRFKRSTYHSTLIRVRGLPISGTGTRKLLKISRG
jgi:hypothetical protein